jgi:Carboxypeptidase regulatory-like domain
MIAEYAGISQEAAVMKRPLFCAMALLAAPPFAARPIPAQIPNNCIVEGMVLSGSTGQPLTKAHVALVSVDNPDRTYSVVTKADGGFLVKDVKSGRYRFSVAREGYVTQEYGQRNTNQANQAGSILTLDPDRHLSEIIFRMVATAVLQGRILDSDGEPLAGARVEAMRHTYAQGQANFTMAGTGQTNDRGEYRIWGLQPGRYFISAVYSVAFDPSGMMVTIRGTNPPLGQRQEESYSRTYYPGTIDLLRAIPIKLGPGEERDHVDISMTMTPTVLVRGRVVNPANPQGARGVSVELISRTQGAAFPLFNSAVTNDDQGKFEMRGVVPGSSYVLACFWNDGSRQYSARQTLDVGNTDIDGVTLAIAPGVTLTGHAHSDAGGQIDLTALRVSLNSREHLPTFGLSLAPVKADGTFSLGNVPEGAFDVYVLGLPDGVHLKSARINNQDTLESGLTIVRGQPLGTLALELGHSSTQIDGVVLDAEKLPISGAQIVLVPDGDLRTRMDFYKTTTTDQMGRFHVVGVPPGAYKLYAWEDIEPGAYMDPEYLRPFESRARQLTIQDLRHYDAELTLIPAPKN